MTCAHVVDVALKKVAGVESVEVSLNKGLATVKLKPGNTVSVPQLWELIHKNGYTPKTTAVSVRGELANVNGAAPIEGFGDERHAAARGRSEERRGLTARLPRKLGQTVIVQGVMVPVKDLKAAVPLQVGQVK